MIKPIDIKKSDLPDKGIYYWYSDYNGVRKLGITKDLNFKQIVCKKTGTITDYLIYIGIGPVSMNSKSTLKKRLIKHIDSNIYSSTFRYSIGALLGIKYEYKLNKGGVRKYFTSDQNECIISQFITEHLTVKISDDKNPWDKEKELISKNMPPLNIHHNNDGWFLTEMKNKREMARGNIKHV